MRVWSVLTLSKLTVYPLYHPSITRLDIAHECSRFCLVSSLPHVQSSPHSLEALFVSYCPICNLRSQLFENKYCVVYVYLYKSHLHLMLHVEGNMCERKTKQNRVSPVVYAPIFPLFPGLLTVVPGTLKYITY